MEVATIIIERQAQKRVVAKNYKLANYEPTNHDENGLCCYFDLVLFNLVIISCVITPTETNTQQF